MSLPRSSWSTRSAKLLQMYLSTPKPAPALKYQWIVNPITPEPHNEIIQSATQINPEATLQAGRSMPMTKTITRRSRPMKSATQNPDDTIAEVTFQDAVFAQNVPEAEFFVVKLKISSRKNIISPAR